MDEHSETDVSYRFQWTVPEGVDPAAVPIATEIVRRGRRNEHLGDGKERRRRAWSAVNLGLGAPAAVLAGISGAVILGDPSKHVLAGVIALTSAGLGALLAFLNPTERAKRAEVDANRYWLISAWVRFVTAADLPGADLRIARGLLLELQRREETVMTTAISGAPPEPTKLPKS